MARFLIKKNGKNRKKENDGTRLEIEKIYEMNFKIHVRTPKAACKSKVLIVIFHAKVIKKLTIM